MPLIASCCRSWTFWACLSASLWGVTAWAQGTQPMAGTYVCTDARGNNLTSDRPIPACADREQRVLGPSGTVKARIMPPQTATQRAEQDARQRAEADARAQEQEARRLERALLVRYPNQQVHDRERAEALGRVSAAIALANQRTAGLRTEQRKIDDEMEFFRKDPSKAPAVLRAHKSETEKALEEQARFIAAQEAERARIDERFNEELARLKQLWAAR